MGTLYDTFERQKTEKIIENLSQNTKTRSGYAFKNNDSCLLFILFFL